MNNSGITVQGLIKKDVDPNNIIVIYDDLAYPFGTIRIAQEKSDGGHNGIASIRKVIPQCVRIRVGIHSVKPGTDELIELKNDAHTARAEFVLKDFRPDEAVHIPEISDRIIDILKMMHTQGLEKTMTEVNKRK
jgi:PTH1 family peptidyl-tRNA hydrolase